MKFAGFKELLEPDHQSRLVWINVDKIIYIVTAGNGRTSINTDDGLEFLIDEPTNSVIVRLNGDLADMAAPQRRL
jgi:hypothetical protein